MADDLKLKELVSSKQNLWDSRIDEYKLMERKLRKAMSWVWIADSWLAVQVGYVVHVMWIVPILKLE